MRRPYLVYIDRYHLGDPLFLQAFARSLAVRPPGAPLLLIHGADEWTERLLEAQGIAPTRVDGRLVLASESDLLLFERAAREVSRRLSGLLTDAVVPAVSLSGADRGLLGVTNGSLTAGDTAWIGHLLDRGVVPVVGLLAVDRCTGRAVVAEAADVIVALAIALDALGAVFLVRRSVGFVDDEAAPNPVDLRTPQGRDAFAEPHVVDSVVAAGIESRVAGLAHIRSAAPEQWPAVAAATPAGTAKTGD